MEQHDERIRAIFSVYLNTITLMMVEIECLDGTYPIEIMNEIRAIFTHIARYSESSDENVQQKNIVKAEGHLKRALLDCYKYSCFSFIESQIAFEQRYKNVDLSHINNGEYLIDLQKLQNDATEAFVTARKNEAKDKNAETLYTDYEKAYQLYHKMYTLTGSITKYADELKLKADIKDRTKSQDRIIGIVGAAFGIVGVALSILFGLHIL
ncbi:MAG: hypothetical protein LBM41_04970 [Ruminococcus sp.]|jgi:hypothetical protein|nr:hypothetical protein [Ruminococcus sp.]